MELPFLTEDPAYKDLQACYDKQGSKLNINQLFHADPQRFQKFRWGSIFIRWQIASACFAWKGRHFLITNANSFHWLQAPQKMSQIWMNSLLSWIHYTQCKPCEGFQMYIAGEMWQNLKQVFEKNAKEQWKRVTLHNQTHTIVHSSAMLCTTKIWLSFMNVVKSY